MYVDSSKQWHDASKIDEVVLGEIISVEDVVAVARYGAKVSMNDLYRERVNKCRKYVDRFSEEEKPIYGITTGLGENWKKFISVEDRKKVQRNNTLSHACSVGEPLDDECVRAMMFVLLQQLGSGHTGVSLPTLVQIEEMLNKGVIPVVPAHGTVGYLCHEGHISCAMIGEGRSKYNGQIMTSKEALSKAGMVPIELNSKEGLSLVSGTTCITAFASLGFYDAITSAQTADIAAAMSLEVLKGTLMAMDPRVHAARPHEHQGHTASNVRRLLENSQIEEKYRGYRVQDALSLRCIPQLHGASKKVISDGLKTLNIELNSSVDNPLIFEDKNGRGEALMACNADGSYVGMACDCATIAVAGLAKMSERRLDRMVNHHVSELPSFLNANPGLNNGLMIPQYAASGILGEIKLLSSPATVDNGFTCANQEDYTSMGGNAAIKFYKAAKLIKYILAVEIMNSCQAQDFYEDLASSPATTSVHDRVREEVPMVEEDTMMQPLMESIADMVKEGEIIKAAEKITGSLEY